LQGIDFENVTRVIKYGIFERMEDEIQASGRGGQSEDSQALFLVLVEPWVYALDTGDNDEEFDGGEDRAINSRIRDAFRDPDEPVAPPLNNARSTKQNRVGWASVSCYQCDICIRDHYAQYLNDTSPNGMYNLYQSKYV
jgi:hypothetical protein